MRLIEKRVPDWSNPKDSYLLIINLLNYCSFFLRRKKYPPTNVAETNAVITTTIKALLLPETTALNPPFEDDAATVRDMKLDNVDVPYLPRM